ncbi:EamA-like transporter family protein [Candidatus Planktophila vernalis]|uniref:EamA-like transporter family protein n=1 Tax=Candidatus Planktophila vernalis TaxID=1884907 RepID=A0A249KV77_9ACTN|nr:DMT family transporter [Candidatus Planktophila vernalis]ASY20609.1 EamA-like transporter family protein [Candidatus Planktophila vernalis]
MASLLAILSSILWGTSDFEGGRLSKKHAPLAVLGFTQVLGLVFGIVLMLASGAWSAQALGSGGYLVPGIIAGLFGYFGLFCLYAGLSTGRMGVVSPISSMGAIVPLTYALINGDRLSTITSIGVVLALVGVFCASGPELSQGLPLKPLLLAIGAALGFGTALTSMSIGSQSSALMTMVSMRGATFFVTISIALKFRTMGGFTKKEYPSLIFIGVADFLANVLLGVACTKGLVSIAMVLGSLFPIATALLAFKFLRERLQRVQYIGIALAVAGVALISAF